MSQPLIDVSVGVQYYQRRDDDCRRCHCNPTLYIYPVSSLMTSPMPRVAPSCSFTVTRARVHSLLHSRCAVVCIVVTSFLARFICISPQRRIECYLPFLHPCPSSHSRRFSARVANPAVALRCHRRASIVVRSSVGCPDSADCASDSIVEPRARVYAAALAVLTRLQVHRGGLRPSSRVQFRVTSVLGWNVGLELTRFCFLQNVPLLWWQQHDVSRPTVLRP